MLHSLFPLASQSLPSPSEATEVIHLNDTSCWTTVLDTVIACFQKNETQVVLEFVFPQMPEDDVVRHFNIENIIHKNEKPPVPHVKLFNYYISDKERIEKELHSIEGIQCTSFKPQYALYELN